MGKKITMLLPDLRGGGAEKVTLILAQEFQKKGYNIELVVLSKKGELLSEALKKFRVIDLHAKRFRDALYPFVEYLKKEQPDAIIAAMWPLTIISVLSRSLARIQCHLLLSDHGILSRQYMDKGLFHRLFLRLSIFFAYRFADVRVGVSSGVAKDISELGFLSKNMMEVIHNPIPPPTFSTEENLHFAIEAWPNTSGKRILSVGRFKSVKNYELLICAVAKLSKKLDIQLLLLGDGELRKELEALVISKGIEDRVSMPGFYSDPTPYYYAADLFVLSSNAEGFGNVIVEAMSHGTPVVSTDCPSGPREILKNCEFGMLVPVGDIESLVSAMAEELALSHDKEKLQVRAQCFAPEKIADQYLKLLLS